MDNHAVVVFIKAVTLSFSRAFLAVFIPLAAGAFENDSIGTAVWKAAAFAGFAAGLRAVQALFTNAEPTDEHVQ